MPTKKKNIQKDKAHERLERKNKHSNNILAGFYFKYRTTEKVYYEKWTALKMLIVCKDKYNNTLTQEIK